MRLRAIALLAAINALFLTGAAAGNIAPSRTPSFPVFPSGAIDDYFLIGQCTEYGVRVPCSAHYPDSRASAETCQWLDGHLSYAPALLPCITDRGLVEWEARTNLATFSNFQGGSWSGGGGATLAPNSIQSPDLSQNAAIFTNAATNGFTNFGNTPVTAATNYTASVYVKPLSGAATGGNFVVNMSNATSTDGCGGAFSIAANGTIAPAGVTAKAAGACVSQTITQLGFGWWRLSVTGTVAGTNATLVIATGGGSPTFTVALFCAQLELGSFSTPCIPTTNTTATRNADAIVPPSTSALDRALRVTPGSIFLQTNQILGFSGAPRMLVFATGNWHINAQASNTILVVNDGTNQVLPTIGNSGTWSSGRVKSSIAYSAATTSALANGGSLATSGSLTRATATGAINIGNTLGNIDGYIERLAVFPSFFLLEPTSP